MFQLNTTVWVENSMRDCSLIFSLKINNEDEFDFFSTVKNLTLFSHFEILFYSFYY